MNIKTSLLCIILSFFFFNNLNSKTIIIDNNNRLTFNDINNLTSFDLTSTNLSEDKLNLII